MTTTPTPKPGPRPGPRPGVTPAVRTQTAARPTVHSDPTRWGRIDDDGSVYVITASGERLIGSWQAGTREEGLAHYHTPLRGPCDRSRIVGEPAEGTSR